MPYIDPEYRAELNPNPYRPPHTVGELNFQLSQVLEQYLDYDNGPPSYSIYNGIIGVLDCLKMEFYRRSVIPYENKKQAENGDVFKQR